MSVVFVVVCAVVQWAQVPPAIKVALPLEITLDRTPPALRAVLQWRHDSEYTGPYTVLVRQRAIDPQFSVAGTVTPTGDSVLRFVLDINEGTLYEVGVLTSLVRTINGQQIRFTVAGYACVGHDVPIAPHRGRVLLVIDSAVAGPLSSELVQLESDLDHEGWQVARTIVPRAEQFDAAAVRRTKDSIRVWYQRGNYDEPASVFLIGRIAVPYSGLYYSGQYVVPPDGHNPDHRGAWPADLYYGTISESGWTDQVADTTGVARAENRNLPGDGKFDNVLVPSQVELRIGRVDFYNLPRLVPQGSNPRDTEIAMLRDYLARNHSYRTGVRSYRWAGLIDDNFPTYPELFARSGWISFPQLVGANNVRAEKWFPTLDTSSRLLAYGCGAGSYTSANGIGGLNEFSSRRVNAAFTMLFGSYFGDWDSQNNLMRVNLARGALTGSWSGRPVWYLHPMAAGETIGDITMMVQNFSPFQGQSVYISSSAQGWIHVALLGDPTLRIYYGRVPPPRQLSVRQEGRSIHLEWQPPQLPSDSLVGYYVYRTLPNGREVAITPEPITDRRFTDTYRSEGIVRYAVRCVGRIRTPSGLIHDLSPAVRAELFTTSVEQANEIPAEVSVVVAPNPVSDVARVTIRTSKPILVHAHLYSLDGRKLATLLHTTVVDEATVMWDTSLLSAGVYMIGVRTSEGATVLHPIVVAR